MEIKASDILGDNFYETINKSKHKYHGDTAPSITIVTVGDDPASKVYVRNKINACEKAGIKTSHKVFEDGTTPEEIKLFVLQSKNPIIVQLPLPPQYNESSIIECISGDTDVDCISDENMAKIIRGSNDYLPCTVQAVIDVIQSVYKSVEGKNILVIGRSNIVGKPLAMALTNLNATVTLAHSKTKNLKFLVKHSEIVVCATGHPHLITTDMIHKNMMIVDVGINRTEDGKIIGDVDEEVKKQVKYYTPVPRGIGPLTVANVVKNTIKLYNRNAQEF